MPRSYRRVADANYAYFVTCSVVEWLPLFEQERFRQIVLDSLAYLREHKAVQLNAFVVMSTHLHAVVWPQHGVDISGVLRNFKRHTSRAISREAAAPELNHYLKVFSAARLVLPLGTRLGPPSVAGRFAYRGDLQ